MIYLSLEQVAANPSLIPVALAALRDSGDFKEPLAQYLVGLLQIQGSIAGGGGTGGTGGTDPGAVQKSGDTMTGQLVFQGDNFSSGATHAIKLTDSTNYYDCFIGMNGNAIFVPGLQAGSGFVYTLIVGLSIEFYGNGVQTTLQRDTNGDLIVTQQYGPNAGKSVNLTFGKWA